MRNIAFINLTGINENCQKIIYRDKTVAQSILDYCNAIPDIDLIIPVATQLSQLKMFFQEDAVENPLILRENSPQALINALVTASGDYDNCVYLYGDTPLLDRELTDRMFTNHYKYYADYSFADGYPYGLSPEILSVSCIKQLEGLAGDMSGPIERDSLFSCLQKDINAFDIETDISPRDMRLKRISLCCDTERNWMQMRRIVDNGGVDSASIIAMDDTIEKYCRTIPAYFQVQIIEKCLQSCSYCPYPHINPEHRNSRKEMSLDKILDLAERIEGFAPDSTISLSLWGEPICHSDLAGVLQGILKRTGLKILIETSGLGWKDFMASHSSLIESDRIDWIFSLDAVNPDLYKILRGEGQQEALATVEHFMTHNPTHTWVQAVRTVENEDDLEQFYRIWKEKTDNVIIQKYDYFCGVLEQKKVTDLSPVKRFPCWHLKRDMVILLDGSVVVCREDLERKSVLGNIFDQELQDIWDKGSDIYKSQLNHSYTGVCERCDEYYTYNF